MQKWLTRAQAADYLGCSLATLDRMIARNKLTRYKVENSRSTRLDREELDAMIKKESETKRHGELPEDDCTCKGDDLPHPKGLQGCVAEEDSE